MGRKKFHKTRTQENRPPEWLVPTGFLKDEFIQYYRAQFIPSIMDEAEFETMVACMRETLPHVFHVTESATAGFQSFLPKFEELNIKVERLDMIDDSIFQLSIDRPTLRKTPELAEFREWLLHRTETGEISRQEFVSMLPPYFLDVHEDSLCLDACAAPGSKTSQVLRKLKTGLMIANDVNLDRCKTLIHLTNRFQTGLTVITCHSAQHLPDLGSFDRIICDAPCSGDGTMRKNPDSTIKWGPRSGIGLHKLQRQILIRCLQMLKIGGRAVYSTCALNPLEDEAVVSSVLQEAKGSIEIVDVSSMFPNLKRSNGMKSWKVFDDQMKEVTEPSETFPASLFPINVIDNIDRCMRFLPHLNNTGGFFVAVLEKRAELPPELTIPPPGKPPMKWRENPFIQLTDQSIIDSIVQDYGMKEDFPRDRLFCRSDGVHEIYYLNEAAANLVKSTDPSTLRAVSCGTRIFSWKCLSDQAAVRAFPCFEGLTLVNKWSTKRRLMVTPEDMLKLLKVGNAGAPYNELSEVAKASAEALTVGGVIFTVQGTDDFISSGMRGRANLSIHVKKETLDQEVFRLIQLFPQLAEQK